LEFYDFKKAINIGIVGTNDTTIPLGTCYFLPHKDISLVTVDNPKVLSSEQKPTLFDMEAKYFEEFCLKYLDKTDIYIFKIVSDYLDNTIPNKEFVKQLIKQNIQDFLLAFK
jgi:hypothetical protein